MAYFSSSVRSHIVSLLPYFIIWGSQKVQPSSRGEDTDFTTHREECQGQVVRRTCGMVDTVAVFCHSNLKFTSFVELVFDWRKEKKEIERHWKIFYTQREKRRGWGEVRAQSKEEKLCHQVLYYLTSSFPWKTTARTALWPSLPDFYINPCLLNSWELYPPHPSFWSSRWLATSSRGAATRFQQL